MSWRDRCASLAAALLAAAGSLGLPACGGEAPPPVVRLAGPDGMDRDVVELVREHVQRAQAAPGNARRRAELAMVYEANDLWDEAERSWADALALEPRRPAWILHRASCAREAGREELALELLRSAAAADPSLALARLRLGEELLEAGDLEGALAQLVAARELAPSDPLALVSLAEARLRAGEVGEAEELCRRAL